MLAKQLYQHTVNGYLGFQPKVISSSAGLALVEGPVSSAALKKMRMHPGLDNFRKPEQQLVALVAIAGMKEGRIYVARIKDLIVGYVTFHPPDEYERWSKGNMACLIELGAIEMAREFRGQGLSTALLKVVFAQDWVEDRIIFATEYYWHWDIEGVDLGVWQYRDLMEKMFRKAGLEPCSTDDPEICSHAANMLMARKGSRVSEQDCEAFKGVCFQGMDLFY